MATRSVLPPPSYSSTRTQAVKSSAKIIQAEIKSLHSSPLEGFEIDPCITNYYRWNVSLFGPPKTIYEGGYFRAYMTFPSDYPYNPPNFRFLTEMFHPNIYDNGEVCISILHPPGDDPISGELPSERWNPSQSVRTILLSVISLLNEPNCASPANIEASVAYKKYKDASQKKKSQTEYAKIVAAQVEKSKIDARADGVVVPSSLEDYCIPASRRPSSSSTCPWNTSHRSSFDIDEGMFYEDDYGSDDESLNTTK